MPAGGLAFEVIDAAFRLAAHCAAGPGELDAQVHIFETVTVGLVEAAHVLEQTAGEHHGGGGDGLEFPVHGDNGMGRGPVLENMEEALTARNADPDMLDAVAQSAPVRVHKEGADSAEASVALHSRDQRAKPVGGDDGVVVQEKDILASCHRCATVAACGKIEVALATLVAKSSAKKLASQDLACTDGFIGRAIINNNDLVADGFVRGGDTLKAVFRQIPFVENWYHDGYIIVCSHECVPVRLRSCRGANSVLAVVQRIRSDVATRFKYAVRFRSAHCAVLYDAYQLEKESHSVMRRFTEKHILPK